MFTILFRFVEIWRFDLERPRYEWELFRDMRPTNNIWLTWAEICDKNIVEAQINHMIYNNINDKYKTVRRVFVQGIFHSNFFKRTHGLHLLPSSTTLYNYAFSIWPPCASARLLSLVRIYARTTLAPRLEWPRDRQITPPRRSKPLAISFFDALDNFLSPEEICPQDSVAIMFALEIMSFPSSTPSGTYMYENVCHIHQKQAKRGSCMCYGNLLQIAYKHYRWLWLYTLKTCYRKFFVSKSANSITFRGQKSIGIHEP